MKKLTQFATTLLFAILAFWAAAGAATPAAPEPAAKGQIQREAERQGLVGERMKTVVERFTYLVQDLHSNGYLSDAQTLQLNQMAKDLQDLNSTHVQAAADALHTAADTIPNSSPALKTASREVETILRELSVFLIRANSAQARAMLLAELRDIILKEQSLLNDTTAWGRQSLEDAAKAADQAKILASTQDLLATRTVKLIDELAVAQASEADALAALRFGSARRILTDRSVVSLLQGATTDITNTAAIDAVGKQTNALKALREAEAILAPDRELQNLLKAREDLRRILEDQIALRKETETTPAPTFSELHNDLLVRQHGLTTRLTQVDAAPFNPSADNQPPVLATLQPANATVIISTDINPVTGALSAMGDAEKMLEASRQAGTVTAQKKAEAYLVRALAMADVMLAKMNNLNALAAAVERSRRTVDVIRQFIALHGQLMDATKRALADSKDSSEIGKSQQTLAAAVGEFAGTLPQSPYSELITKHLTTASKAMARAADPLKSNQPANAQAPQAEAAKSLADALELAERELENAVSKFNAAQNAADNKSMSQKIDAVASQQKGLLAQAQGNPTTQGGAATQGAATQGAATQGAATQGAAATQNGGDQPPATTMAAQQTQLAAATTQMAAESETTPMNQALDKTTQEMNQAAQQLQNMPAAPKLAAPYMKEALDLLHQAKQNADDQGAAEEITAEMTAEIEKIDVKVLNLLQRQKELREQTEKADLKLLPIDMAGEQTVLHAEATAVSEGDEIIGKDLYAKAASSMKEAIGHLYLSKRPEAVEAQKRAEKELAEVENAIKEAMKKVTEIVDSDEPAEPEEHGPPHPPTIDVVTKTLMVAAKERNLRLLTRQTGTKQLPPLAGDQDALKEITDTLGTLKGGDVAQEFFDAASGHMTKASDALKKQILKDSVTGMQNAEIELRKALVALAKNMKPRKPHPPRPEPPHPTTPNQEKNPDPQEGERSFSRQDPEGEKAGKDQGRWQSLGPRERDALNQNFNRDLPVEFRDMLRDYYENLAKTKPGPR